MAAEDQVVLELFVQGQSAQSNAALELVHRICEAELGDRYCLEVIDIHHHPERAVQVGVIATPALVRRQPEPVLRTIGRFDDARVRQGLGLDEQ